MPGEWPPMCESQKHRGTATPAVDRYVEKKTNMRYYLCRDCSIKLAPILTKRGWTFRQLTSDQKTGIRKEHE